MEGGECASRPFGGRLPLFIKFNLDMLERIPLFLGQDRPDQKIFALVWRYLLQQGPGSPMVRDTELWPENVLWPFHLSLTAP